jgi:hypothetical protein
LWEALKGEEEDNDVHDEEGDGEGEQQQQQQQQKIGSKKKKNGLIIPWRAFLTACNSPPATPKSVATFRDRMWRNHRNYHGGDSSYSSPLKESARRRQLQRSFTPLPRLENLFASALTSATVGTMGNLCNAGKTPFTGKAAVGNQLKQLFGNLCGGAWCPYPSAWSVCGVTSVIEESGDTVMASTPLLLPAGGDWMGFPVVSTVVELLMEAVPKRAVNQLVSLKFFTKKKKKKK